IALDVELSFFIIFFFFFSSRRRHTRCLSDWSSDVCSSDLGGEVRKMILFRRKRTGLWLLALGGLAAALVLVEVDDRASGPFQLRSEEHTSELQSLRHLVCRLLLEKKNKKRRK